MPQNSVLFRVPSLDDLPLLGCVPTDDTVVGVVDGVNSRVLGNWPGWRVGERMVGCGDLLPRGLLAPLTLGLRFVLRLSMCSPQLLEA